MEAGSPYSRFLFSRSVLVPVCFGVIAVSGCGPRTAKVAAAPEVLQNSNSYLDLQAGGQLRVLVPILKSGGYVPKTASNGSGEEHTIVLRAADLEGYELIHYAIQARRGGRVQLRFTSAEVLKDGKTVDRPQSINLPFALPSKSDFIRLIYLVRSSHSDHDMAIVASPNKISVENLTAKVEHHPEACVSSHDVSCEWVPRGISVRPE